jgi:cation diffusion facilitator CzcD-associated flavoprotein CzcO
LTPGPGYLEALVEPNVNYVTTHIKRFTATGIEAVDGTHREYDTIICATGFDLSHKPWFPVIGRNGVDLRDEWAERPHTYLSMTPGPNFPNWWIAAGPNSGVGSGSFLLMIENAIEYATKVSLEPRQRHWHPHAILNR